MEKEAANASTCSEGTSKEQHKARLAEARKNAKGDKMLLTPVLMHNANFFNMRVMLTVGKALWSEQTLTATEKRTPVQHLKHCIARSSPYGEKFLRWIYLKATFDSTQWCRLGLQMEPGLSYANMGSYFEPLTGRDAPGVKQEDIPPRLASLLLHVIEARFWTRAGNRHGWPGAFAGIMADGDDGVSCCKTTKYFYETMLKAEAEGIQNAGVMALRKEADFVDWPINQLGFRLLAHHNFELRDEVIRHFRRQFIRMGDSKFIEESGKMIRQVESRTQDPKIAGPLSAYHKFTLPTNPLATRKVPHVTIPDGAAFEQCKPILRRPWSEQFNYNSTKMPKQWNVRKTMLKTSGGFKSKTHNSQRHAIGAGQVAWVLIQNRCVAKYSPNSVITVGVLTVLDYTGFGRFRKKLEKLM